MINKNETELLHNDGNLDIKILMDQPITNTTEDSKGSAEVMVKLPI